MGGMLSVKDIAVKNQNLRRFIEPLCMEAISFMLSNSGSVSLF